MAKLYGCDLKGLLACRSVDNKGNSLKTQIAPLFQRPLVKWLTNQKVPRTALAFRRRSMKRWRVASAWLTYCTSGLSG